MGDPSYLCWQGVGEELLSRLFRQFPGMEYCDLKTDRATGRSKVGGAASIIQAGMEQAGMQQQGHNFFVQQVQ